MRKMIFRFINPDGELYTITLKELTELDEGLVRHEDFRGEFTGLLDKNGVEIFEGDIISHPPHWENGSVTTLIENIHTLCKDDISLGNFETEVEVIGNIYENPELLT